jgi:RNA polymerase sigma factor (sigma-70 family)
LFPVSRRGGNIPVETMSERDDQLIAEFNARRSEDAFAALVRQHVNLVFATALRQVGDAGTAEEITQNVFVALAQAAGKLGSHPTIAGWLHQTALNKSREWLRSELRRHRREQVAVNLELAGAEGDSVWSSLVPLLDEALLELREPDRQAVILHFMEGQTFQEVGSALGVGEDAARKRVNRCLGQLTHFFRRRGFAAPALVAGAPLFTLSSHAAPAGLAASATTAGLAAAHSAATSSLTLIKGALKIMAWTKAKTAAVAVAAVIVATGTTAIIVNQITPGGSAAERAPVEMQMKWQAGKKYVMHRENTQTSETKQPNQPKPVKQVSKMTQDFNLSQVRQLDNGGRQLQLEFEHLTLEVFVGDRKGFSADSTQNPAQDAGNPVGARLRKMVGARLQYFINANGKVEKMEGYQELVKRVAGDNPQEQAAFRNLFNESTLEQYGSIGEDTTPRRVVKLGDSWAIRLEVPADIGVLNLDLKCTFKNWEQRADHKSMRIKFTGIFSSQAAPNTPSPAVTIEKAKLLGELWFDPELGMVVEFAFDADMSLKINQGGQILSAPVNQKTRYALVAVEDLVK